MVQVFLPMGYPLQSGYQFANVIYQGQVVRLYTLAVDPRSNAQLQNRRFLSDVGKMKKCLGLWARGSLKAVLGSSWGTVLYQIIKADIENYWSEALAEWETFAEQNQDAWRSAAPYQATFNDQGQIFFALTRVIARVLIFYSGKSWKSSATWTETQSALAAAWWAKDLTDAFSKGTYTTAHALFNGGAGFTDFYIFGKMGRFAYTGNGTHSHYRWIADCVTQTTQELLGTSGWFGHQFAARGLHMMKAEHVTGTTSIGNFNVS